MSINGEDADPHIRNVSSLHTMLGVLGVLWVGLVTCAASQIAAVTH